MRHESEASDATRLEEATAVVAARFGQVDIDARIKGFAVTATKAPG